MVRSANQVVCSSILTWLEAESRKDQNFHRTFSVGQNLGTIRRECCHHAARVRGHGLYGGCFCGYTFYIPSFAISLTYYFQAAEILSAIKTSAAVPPQAKKKEKQQMKHRAFLERLQSSQSPYSRSHNRRLKRKGKQQLAAKMDDLNTVLKDLESGAPEESKDIPGVTSSRKREDRAGTDMTSSVRRIGEGKGATLSTTQRKKVLYVFDSSVPIIDQLTTCVL